MKYKIISRVIEEAEYIIRTNKTVREISKIFKVSKSTVHKDLQYRLKDIDEVLHKDVDKILKYHTDVRHIRGGESTRLKYMMNK